MKVITRDKFLDYPEGTIFAKGKEWYFDNLCIKGVTFPADEDYCGDFLYLDTSWPDAWDSGKAIDLLAEAIETGKSFECEKGYSRDGMFDLEDLFLVYEKDDLEFLKEQIENAIRSC